MFVRSVQVFTCSVLTVSAQTGRLVVPNQYSNTLANTSDNAPLGAVNQHFQQDYSGSSLISNGLTPGETITAIGFRVAAGESSIPAQTVSDYSIQMGLGVSPGSMSLTFANNGSAMTLVRSGALDITAGQFAGGAGVNPFGMIQLSSPYTYTGGDLLIDVSYSGFSNGRDANVEYPYDSSLGQTAFGSGPTSTTADKGLFNEAIVFAFDVLPQSVPEPTTMGFLGWGALGVFLLQRNRKRRS